jgi:hypothetical protein
VVVRRRAPELFCHFARQTHNAVIFYDGEESLYFASIYGFLFPTVVRMGLVTVIGNEARERDDWEGTSRDQRRASFALAFDENQAKVYSSILETLTKSTRRKSSKLPCLRSQIPALHVASYLHRF